MQPTVLVADDDDAIRDLLVMLLSEAGYKTLSTDDGRKAVDLAIEQKPDIALLDVMMPVMDGFAACRAIKADPRIADTPVLLLTALAQTRSKVRGLDDGATDYITKPFENQELLARLRAALLEKARRDTLAAEALTDALTNLTNRRGLELQLDQLLAHTTRANETLSLLLFDADRFKSVNDTYGHDTGDIVLATLAHRAQETMRSQDVIGRFGGEEFLAILPGAGRVAALTAAERLRSHIATMPIDTPKGSISVTVSVGIATYQAGIETDRSTLLQAADQALYTAKNSGRNCVVHADGALAAPPVLPEPPESARALLEALTMVHPVTADHARAVAQLCWHIGEIMQITSDERARIALAGLLHDAGKLVARSKSLKILDLQITDSAALFTYVLAGAKLLQRIPTLSSTAELVAAHCERWDGSGYPGTARNDQIPLGSRIIAVASVFDALCRTNRKITTQDATTMLKHGSGTLFDPDVVIAALAVVSAMKPSSTVE